MKVVVEGFTCPTRSNDDFKREICDQEQILSLIELGTSFSAKQIVG